ncbi:MAG: hypothetical protein WA814_09415 [Candidatus Baltobacteraceae bacterium]
MSITRLFTAAWASQRIALVAGAIILSSVATASAQTASSPEPSTACSGSQGSHGISIKACTFTLGPSPAGNPNYFVNVTIKYAAPSATTAVRFRCAFGNGSEVVKQYGVLRQSGSTLHFVSPFASSSSALKSVECDVDAT